MLDDLKSYLNEIKNSNEFVVWKKDNFWGYLVSAFLNNNLWQLDFFNPEDYKITSFRVEQEVVFSETSDIFMKEKKELKELFLDNVKIDLTDAEKLITKLMDSDYKGESIQNKIIILQVLGIPVWNITYITKSFSILNVKIDAVNGEIIRHSLEKISNFMSKI